MFGFGARRDFEAAEARWDAQVGIPLSVIPTGRLQQAVDSALASQPLPRLTEDEYFTIFVRCAAAGLLAVAKMLRDQNLIPGIVSLLDRSVALSRASEHHRTIETALSALTQNVRTSLASFGVRWGQPPVREKRWP